MESSKVFFCSWLNYFTVQEADDIQELSAEGRFLRLQDFQMFFVFVAGFLLGKRADDESNAVQKGVT